MDITGNIILTNNKIILIIFLSSVFFLTTNPQLPLRVVIGKIFHLLLRTLPGQIIKCQSSEVERGWPQPAVINRGAWHKLVAVVTGRLDGPDRCGVVAGTHAFGFGRL